MSLNSMEEYYQKVIQLQDKLRKSEEERLNLEIKFNEMLQSIKEEEEVHFKKLRSKYKKFLEEDRRRQQRNDKILDALDRIENRTAVWEAKTEKFKEFRKRYQNYMTNVKQIPDETAVPTFEKDTFGKDEIVDKYMRSLSQNSNDYAHKQSDVKLYEEKYSKLGNINSCDGRSPNVSNNYDLTQLKTSKDHENSLKQNLPVSKIDYGKPEIFVNDSKFIKLETRNKCDRQEPYLKSNSNLDRLLNDNIRNDPTLHQHFQTIPNQPLSKSSELVRQTLQKINYPPHTNIDKPKSSTEELKQLRDKLNESFDAKIQPSPAYFEDNENYSSRNATGIELSEPCKVIETFNNKHYWQNLPPKTTLDLVENSPGPRKPTIESGELAQRDMKQLPPASEKLPPFPTNTRVISDELLGETIQDLPRKESIISLKVSEEERPSKYNEIDLEEAKNQNVETSNRKLDQNTGKLPVEQNNVDVQRIQPCPTTQEAQLFKDTQQPAPQYDIESKPLSYDTNDDQLGEGGQPLPVEVNSDLNSQLSNQYENDLPYETENTTEQLIRDDNIQDTTQYDQQSVQGYEEPVQMQYYENGHFVGQYDDNGQPLHEYDQNAQYQYDDNGKPFQQYDVQYDENGQPNAQYDANGHIIQQYDHNTQLQYDDNGQIVNQYDVNGQPFQQYEEIAQLQYTEDGQPIGEYDANGHLLQQYDPNAQLQYDENGQPMYQYDENGQPLQHYYDENGQPVQYYEYSENGNTKQDEYYNHQNQEQVQQNLQVEPSIHLEPSESQSDIPEDLKAPREEIVLSQEPDKIPQELAQNQDDNQIQPLVNTKVFDMLETDSESLQQDTKITNDSDFDFSNG